VDREALAALLRPKPVVLEVRDLRSYLFTRWGVTRAVDGVSFRLHRGETLGIVGESGCGKSMLAMSLVRLLPRPAGRIVGGQILFNGEDLLAKSETEMRAIRGQRISVILQDPQQSLNPVYSIGNQLQEALQVHSDGQAANGHGPSLRERAIGALHQVRLPDPVQRLASYPHQLSGGMKQRVVGAMAMAFHPDILIADEPTTSLDVTIQAQYLALLKRLQAETSTSIVLVTHNFGVVSAVCDRVAVMYAGRIVEYGPVAQVFARPSHPYTRALLRSLPSLEQRVEQLDPIEGSPPALHNLPSGCHFWPRCRLADAACRQEYPPAFWVDVGHAASCWRLEASWAPSRS
jgi:oligopeptide/dipeptide ABC transporter ATP-binding protein